MIRRWIRDRVLGVLSLVFGWAMIFIWQICPACSSTSARYRCDLCKGRDSFTKAMKQELWFEHKRIIKQYYFWRFAQRDTFW